MSPVPPITTIFMIASFILFLGLKLGWMIADRTNTPSFYGTTSSTALFARGMHCY